MKLPPLRSSTLPKAVRLSVAVFRDRTGLSLASCCSQVADVGPSPEKDSSLSNARHRQTIVDLSDDFATEAPNLDTKLFFLYPKTKGWAIIGRNDKHLAVAPVKGQSLTEDKISFSLKESGPLMVWSRHGSAIMDGATFAFLVNNLYQAELPITPGPHEITLSR